MSPPSDPALFSMERYGIVRPIGQGGMGVVYEVIDRERNQRVALKTMAQVDGASLYRFKREFRSLAELDHPNLVHLHELVVDGDLRFFTMELVEGVDFVSYVHGSTYARSLPTEASGIESRRAENVHDMPTGIVKLAHEPVTDWNRLRGALRQLAEGLHALHVVGKLHRDIKPSNILVTNDGRVVILDFGLVVDLGSRATERDVIAGTVEYMSPEQATSSNLGPASDWYSVGVVLYEVLTGRLPHTGNRIQVLIDKQQVDPPRPSSLGFEVPRDLESLCMALLAREPLERPGGEEVLRRLGGSAIVQEQRISTGSTAGVLVGRDESIDAIAQAFESTRRGFATAVILKGSSGVGKTALARQAAELLVERDGALLLRGRCFEHETLPFKAVDSLVDGLSHHLAGLRREKVEALLPTNIRALAKIFPVLLRVEAIAAFPKQDVPDPQELRRRAFAAFRELCQRLCTHSPLILLVDNLQWGDADSAALFGELFRAPDPPAVLLLGTIRSESVDGNPIVDVLREAGRRAADVTEIHELEVEPLAYDDARALAKRLLGAAATSELATAIADEAGGSPLFVEALVGYIQAREIETSEGLDLDDVLYRTVGGLPEAARRLLEVTAIAGRPTDVEFIQESAHIGGAEATNALHVLRAARLVRTSRAHGHLYLEPFHDRVRETIVDRLDPDVRKAVHRRLAMAMVGTGQPDPQSVLTHLLGAGEDAEAARQSVLAAARADENLAFDRAADFYRTALSLGGPAGFEADELRRLRRRLGDALANAGRGQDAAEVYAAAAESAQAAEQIELRRLVADQLLRSGRVTEGVRATQRLLEAVGITWPRTPFRALLAILWNMLLVVFARFRFERRGLRDSSQITPEELSRIDVCWSVNLGLSFADPVRSIAFQKRQLVLSYRAGEPIRLARALGAEVVAWAANGIAYDERTQRVVESARRIASRAGSTHATAFVTMASGLADYLSGRNVSARASLEEALDLFRNRCTGVAWELASTEAFLLWTLFRLGEFRALVERSPQLVKGAEERGDLYLQCMLRMGLPNLRWLVLDRPEDAHREALDILGRLPGEPAPMHRYYAMIARVHACLYSGDLEEAMTLLEADWDAVEQSMIFRIESVRHEADWLRMRVRARLAFARGDESLLALAREDAERLSRSPIPWVAGVGHLAEASFERRRGRHDEALAHLDRAQRLFDEGTMRMFSAATRRRRGEMVGHGSGADLVDQADAAMRAEGVVDPRRMADLLAPL